MTNFGVSRGPSSYGARSVNLNELDRATPQVDGRNGLTLSIIELTSTTIGTARVETLIQLRRATGSENYRTGTLRPSAAGFTYDLNADNGDPATFMLTVQEGGATTSYTVPWSLAYSFDGFDPASTDPGF